MLAWYGFLWSATEAFEERGIVFGGRCASRPAAFAQHALRHVGVRAVEADYQRLAVGFAQRQAFAAQWRGGVALARLLDYPIGVCE
jgi:hypothetical protein